MQGVKNKKKPNSIDKEIFKNIFRDHWDEFKRLHPRYDKVVVVKKYRERYQEMSGRDPMICRYCGQEMDLLKIIQNK